MTTKQERDTQGDDPSDEHTSKKQRSLDNISVKPDVIVVVGGKEFHEYSPLLCASSEYFNAAFRSGMAESQTKRFEFPDKDPKEWELVRTTFVPFRTKVTVDNVFTLIPWFDELCSHEGLKECEKVLRVDLTRMLPSAQCFDLSPPGRNLPFQLVRRILEVYPRLFLDLNLQARIVSLLVKQPRFRRAMWDFWKPNLPPLEEVQQPSANSEVLKNGITASIAFAYYVTQACGGKQSLVNGLIIGGEK